MIGIDEGSATYGTKDASGLVIRPSVKYNIDGKTYVEGSYVYNLNTVKDKDDVSNGYFGVNFRWDF
jgi:hypothetical protein